MADRPPLGRSVVRAIDALMASCVAVARCGLPDMLAIAPDTFFERKLIPARTYQDPGLCQIVNRLAGYSEPTRQDTPTCYQVGIIIRGRLVFVLARHVNYLA